MGWGAYAGELGGGEGFADFEYLVAVFEEGGVLVYYVDEFDGFVGGWEGRESMGFLELQWGGYEVSEFVKGRV